MNNTECWCFIMFCCCVILFFYPYYWHHDSIASTPTNESTRRYEQIFIIVTKTTDTTTISVIYSISHGPLARYVKWRVAHALGIPRTFSPPLRVSDAYMHHGTCVTHVPWCMLASLNNSFLWNRWRGKRCRHSQRMRNPQFYVSGKRPIECDLWG